MSMIGEIRNTNKDDKEFKHVGARIGQMEFTAEQA